MESGIHPRVIQVSRRPGVADPDVRIILDNPNQPSRGRPLVIDPEVQVIDYRPASQAGGDPSLRVSSANLHTRRPPTQQSGSSTSNNPPPYRQQQGTTGPQPRPQSQPMPGRFEPPPPYEPRPGPSREQPRPTGAQQTQPRPGPSQSRPATQARPRPDPSVFVNDPILDPNQRIPASPATIAEADSSNIFTGRRNQPARQYQGSPDLIEISPPNQPQIPVVTIDSSPDVPPPPPQRPTLSGTSRTNRPVAGPSRPRQQPVQQPDPQPQEVRLHDTPPNSPPIRYDEAFPPLPNRADPRLAPPFDPRRSQLYARRQNRPGNQGPTPRPPGNPQK